MGKLKQTLVDTDLDLGDYNGYKEKETRNAWKGNPWSERATNVATGIKPIRVTRKTKAKAPKPKKQVVNKNKSTIKKPTTSAAKAKAQKAAIRKRIAAKVAAAKKKKK